MVAFAGLAAILGHSKSIWLGWWQIRCHQFRRAIGNVVASRFGNAGCFWRGNGVVADCVSSIAGAICLSVLMLVLGQPLPTYCLL